MNGASLGLVLKQELAPKGVAVLGIASAFVSVNGMRDMLAITRAGRISECRMIAGISNWITHPQALREAMDAGWRVRLGSAQGKTIFHPKMIVSGRKFQRDGGIEAPSFAYVGSSNLTRGGLWSNVECGVIARAEFAPPTLGSCFAALWQSGVAATEKLLNDYATQFAQRNRERRVVDLEALGVGDGEGDIPADCADLSLHRKVIREAISSDVAAAAWTGLESFTGEYRFQVEFPRIAGQVVRRIIGGASDRNVPVMCPHDGTVRQMSYRFYDHNGMFRLNIPNDTPGVAQARRDHNGIALIEQPDRKGIAARLTIVSPGPQLKDAIGRSYLLGTWGTTSTRAYGWY